MKWGARRADDHDTPARRLACAIFHLRASARLYTTRQVNAIGQVIYWLHLDGPSSALEQIQGVLGSGERKAA